jgi:AraC-like DNA-binding protein
LTEIENMGTNTVWEFAMSRTSLLLTERALTEVSNKPEGQSVLGPTSAKPRQLPGKFEIQPASDTLERHYSINEISRLWGLSQKTVRRIFEKEPGVLELANPRSRRKRTYVTRRIPESVLQRVYRKLQKPA